MAITMRNILLGLSDVYLQGSAQREDVRSTSVYPFAQDSWKIKPNLTLNYGLRWEFDSSAGGHQRARGNLPAGTKQHGLSLQRVLTADYPAPIVRQVWWFRATKVFPPG